MVQKIVASSWSNLQSHLSKGSTHEEGAYQMFDEMLTNEFDDWRPPNRILDVTIHKVWYPITESLLRQVFDPFGVVEDVYVCKGLEFIEARVVFQSKHEAAEAYGELHGRNIYDGCCQLDIKWGLYQEREATRNISRLDTTKNLSSTPLQPYTMSIVNMETVPVTCFDAAPSIACGDTTRDTNDNVPTNSLMKCSSIVIGMPASEVEPSERTMKSVNSPEMSIDIWFPVAFSLLSPQHASACSQDFDQMPNHSNNNILVSSNISIVAPPSTMTTTVLEIAMLPDKFMLLEALGITEFPQNDLLGSLRNIFNRFIGSGGELQRAYCDESIFFLWPLQMNCTEWQPWPPPLHLVVRGVGLELRPSPWPSFTTALEITARRCYSFPRKPPWPSPVHKHFRFFLAGMLQYWEYMMEEFTSLRCASHAGTTRQFFPGASMSMDVLLLWLGYELLQKLTYQKFGGDLLGSFIMLIQAARQSFLIMIAEMVQFLDYMQHYGGLCQSIMFDRFELCHIGEDSNYQVLVSAKSRVVVSYDGEWQCKYGITELVLLGDYCIDKGHQSKQLPQDRGGLDLLCRLLDSLTQMSQKLFWCLSAAGLITHISIQFSAPIAFQSGRIHVQKYAIYLRPSMLLRITIVVNCQAYVPTCSQSGGPKHARNTIIFVYYSSDMPRGQPWPPPECMIRMVLLCLISVFTTPCDPSFLARDGSSKDHNHNCQGVFVGQFVMDAFVQEQDILATQLLWSVKRIEENTWLLLVLRREMILGERFLQTGTIAEPSASWDHLRRCRNLFKYCGDEADIQFIWPLLLHFRYIMNDMVIFHWKTRLLNLLYMMNGLSRKTYEAWFSGNVSAHKVGLAIFGRSKINIKALYILWDPGGVDIIHRLEGKPNLKKGGMLGYRLGLHYGPRQYGLEQAGTHDRDNYMKRAAAASRDHRMNYPEHVIVPLLPQAPPVSL